jgi:hypothetical protein
MVVVRACSEHDTGELIGLELFDFLISNNDRLQAASSNNVFSRKMTLPNEPLELVYLDCEYGALENPGLLTDTSLVAFSGLLRGMLLAQMNRQFRSSGVDQDASAGHRCPLPPSLLSSFNLFPTSDALAQELNRSLGTFGRGMLQQLLRAGTPLLQDCFGASSSGVAAGVGKAETVDGMIKAIGQKYGAVLEFAQTFKCPLASITED